MPQTSNTLPPAGTFTPPCSSQICLALPRTKHGASSARLLQKRSLNPSTSCRGGPMRPPAPPSPAGPKALLCKGGVSRALPGAETARRASGSGQNPVSVCEQRILGTATGAASRRLTAGSPGRASVGGGVLDAPISCPSSPAGRRGRPLSPQVKNSLFSIRNSQFSPVISEKPEKRRPSGRRFPCFRYPAPSNQGR